MTRKKTTEMTKKETLAKLLWERFSPDHEIEWPPTHASEYRLAVEDIVNLLDRDRAAVADLTEHWASFCDADAFAGSDTFLERMEAAGYIEVVPVTPEALEDPFAYERGIVPGGVMWQLTSSGRDAIARANNSAAPASAADQDGVSQIAVYLDCEPDVDSILHTIREIQADLEIAKERAAPASAAEPVASNGKRPDDLKNDQPVEVLYVTGRWCSGLPEEHQWDRITHYRPSNTLAIDT